MTDKLINFYQQTKGAMTSPILGLAVLTAFLSAAPLTYMNLQTQSKLDALTQKVNSYKPLEIHVNDVPATASAKPKTSTRSGEVR